MSTFIPRLVRNELMGLATHIVLLLLCVHHVQCVNTNSFAMNTDRYALLAFKAGITGDPLLVLSQWTPLDFLHCSWNGVICSTIGDEHRVVGINLPDSSLSGSISKDIQALTELLRINLRNNSLYGSIPQEITRIQTLHKIILSGNSLSGGLPADLKSLINLEHLDVSGNLLEGTIPSGLGSLKLAYLNLSRNVFSGSIPSDVPGSATLDLSANNLTGMIPSTLSSVSVAAFLNNPGLCGVPLPVPCSSSPPPSNVPGGTPPETPVHPVPVRDEGRLSVKEILAIVIGDAVGIVLLGLVFLYCLRRNRLCNYVKRRSRRFASSTETDSTGGRSRSDCIICLRCCCGEGSEWLDDSGMEGELILFETDKNDHLTFDLEDLLRASAYVIGKGGSGGIVYKAVLESGVTLAVRRLAGDGVGGRKQKVFDAEVQVVGRIRHPCIVKLRAYYSGPDEKLLVYDYIPNGSLSTALHARKAPYTLTSLTWAERLRIARRVADGLAHIHECGPKKYIHGELTPKNILLGSNMDAYIADFGMMRLITMSGSTNNSRSGSRNATCTSPLVQSQSQSGEHTFEIAVEITPDEESNPYRPPEAKLGKPTQKWDTYAFGVVMLELVTGRSASSHQKHKRKQTAAPESSNPPVPEGDIPLVEYVRRAWEENNTHVQQLLDPTLMRGIVPPQRDVAEFVKLALSCVAVSSEHRPKMKQVFESLKKIGS